MERWKDSQTRRQLEDEGSACQAAWPPVGHRGRWASAAHVLFYGTLLLAMAMSVSTVGTYFSPVITQLAFAVMLAAWYWWWIVKRSGELAASARLRLLYFGVVAIIWTGLLWLDPAYELLSFSIFTQMLGHLPWQTAIWATALGIFLVHLPPALRDGIAPIHVVFGVVSLAVLVLIVVSLRSVTQQSIRLQRVIEELKAARTELARAAHHAGALEERHRLAREVHDTIAQALTSVVMLLETAQSAGPGSTRIKGLLDQAMKTARDGLGEVRSVVWALRPEPLESGGSIGDALERISAQIAAAAGIEVRALITGTPRPLPPALEATLLRVAQEGLANVARHARAREAAVTFSYLDEVVVLDIWDDGVGFDHTALPAEPKRQGGLGLVGMRERVMAIGGSLTIESTPGEGTTLGVQLPVGSASLQTEDAYRGRS